MRREEGGRFLLQQSWRDYGEMLSVLTSYLSFSLIRWPVGRRFRFHRLEFWLVRIMTVGAKKVGPLSRSSEVAGSLPVDPCLPVPEDISMTFSAEPIALGKVDHLPIIQSQLISISCIVAVEAPTHGLGMMQLDRSMFVLEISFLSVDFHGRMTITAGKHSFGEGRGRDRKFLADL